MTTVNVNQKVRKLVSKLPIQIQGAFKIWVQAVEFKGIREIRHRPGYHDEPLKGKREGQRSVRLNKAYRVIYVEVNGDIEITVVEVNKHKY